MPRVWLTVSERVWRVPKAASRSMDFLMLLEDISAMMESMRGSTGRFWADTGTAMQSRARLRKKDLIIGLFVRWIERDLEGS